MENKKKVGRPKGQRKTGGRQKGTPNRMTSSIRSWLSELIDDHREQVAKDLQDLEPKDRLQMLEKFMQYTTPKMSNVQQSIDLNILSDDQLNTIIEEITKDVE